MTSSSYERGRAAEDAAAVALESAGYRVIESNYRIVGSEIDHICRDDGGFVFVEVRARSAGAIEPSATLGLAKLRLVMRGARMWLARHGATGTDWRMLVVAVDLDEDGRPVGTAIIEDPFSHIPEYHDGDL